MTVNDSRKSSTESLISSKQSDIERWSHKESLMPAWDDRTKLIASLVPDGTKVFEFGAGAGVLKSFLPADCVYEKSDLVDRDGKTRVIDLNAENLEPLVGFDTAVFSGVFEYIHDIPRLAGFLTKHFETVIFSYAALEKNSQDRRGHGWVNDYTIKALLDIFHKENFLLYNYQTWKTQTVCCLRKAPLNSNPALSNIENTLVISLGDEVRKSHINAELTAFGCERHSFFSATRYDSNEVRQAIESGMVLGAGKCFRCGKPHCNCPNNVLIPKQIGNWFSFLRALHVISLAQYSVAMICEDDVKFTYYASEVFSSALEDGDIITSLNSDKPTLLRLGYPGFSRNIHHSSGSTEFSDKRVMSNSCFICNSAYANHVIELMNQTGSIAHTSDVFFHNLCIDDKIAHYTAQPPAAFDLSQSRLVYSSIHPKNVDKIDVHRERTHVKKLYNAVGFAKVFGGNFGDVLGNYLFEKVTGIKAHEIAINNAEVKQNNSTMHYLIVGSILKHTTSNALLWGIGIMDNGDVDKVKDELIPSQVYALRGPKTRQALKEYGYNIPENIALGDPALLLPLVCEPSSVKDYAFGIVPHFTEYDEVKRRYQDHPNVLVICLGNHESDADIDSTINNITRCERILSSSLHGIIVAHAYGISSAWCHFTDITSKGQKGTNWLKYEDYFASVDLLDVSSAKCMSDNAEFPPVSYYTLPEQNVIKSIQTDLLKFCPFNLYGSTPDHFYRVKAQQETDQNQFTFSELVGM